MTDRCSPPVPILRSFDEAARRAFCVDFLGFEITFEHRFEPGLPRFMGPGGMTIRDPVGNRLIFFTRP